VATGAQRDKNELREGVARWVRDHGDLVPGRSEDGRPLEVTGVDHAAGGMANETVMVEMGRGHPGMVLRLPPLEPTFPGTDLSAQAAVQNAVAAAGIPAPAPTVFVSDLRWIGTPFLVMPRVNGIIPGPAPVFDPMITGASPERQRSYVDGLLETLAAVHSVDWQASGIGPLLPGPTLDGTLDHWTRYVEWAGEGAPLPVLGAALSWCRRHQPPAAVGDDPGDAPALVWGDPRLGNLVFDEAGVVHAVLDWDLAAIGPPEMDLGWYFGLEFMMDRLFGQRVPGFPERAEAVETYQRRSGHTVSNLAWHEVFALVRALAINDRHQRIAAAQRQGTTGRGRPDRRTENPMIEILSARIDAAG
jgi:aminoglycoside phosphotransferase (APT) family kinase protein